LLITLGCAQPRAGSPEAPAIIRQDTLAASAYTGNDAAGTGGAEARANRHSSDKTLVIGLGTEVRGFSLMNNLQNKYVEDFVHGNLFLQDEQGRWYPVLAAESPSVDAGTWKLFDDGTSEVTYKLKRGIKWHDGAEFTVHDLVLWWRVGNDRDLPYQGRNRAEPITRMVPLDDYTLVTTWRRWDAESDTIDLRMMWPMPTHVLGEIYETDKVRFANHPYWTTEYFGLGPYKLTNFVPGSHMELAANNDYVLGAPKIQNIVIKFHSDQNSLVAGLLAGDIQVTLHGSVSEGALSMTEAINLGRRWGESKEGKVIFFPYRISLLAVQLNQELQRPAALNDVRVRQALLHAMDRQSLVDSQFSGIVDVAHGWLSPQDPDYGLIADGITRFDFDPARAERLFSDAGWQKGSDGILADARGERLEIEYRATGRDPQNTATIVADQWKRVGVDTHLNFVPEARLKDSEYMGKFPGIRNHTMVAAPTGGSTGRFLCFNMPGPENNWLNTATNPPGYCTQEMERANAAMEAAFPFDAKMGPFKEMMRIALRDLPYLPLHFESEPIAVRSNVSGIDRVPPKDRGRIGMHAYLWTID